MREDMAMLNVREGLVGLLPRLRRFAWVLSGSALARDALLRRACAGMLDTPHRFPQDMHFNRLAYRQVYRAWAADLNADGNTSAAVGDSEVSPAVPFRSGDSVPDDTSRLIHTLAPQTRAALLLIHGERFTYAEAAQVLDVAEEALKARVTRARIGLTDFLSGAPAGMPDCYATST